eukprot:12936295-Prorocentrum_lima.AAC.1
MLGSAILLAPQVELDPPAAPCKLTPSPLPSATPTCGRCPNGQIEEEFIRCDCQCTRCIVET